MDCSPFLAASIILFSFIGAPLGTSAQEFPNPLYQTNQFNTSVVFRQNVCDIQGRYDNGEIPLLGDALEGLELHTILALSQYFLLDDEGKIDPEYPGLTAILMDELAKRGKFTWRNSFAVTQEPEPGRTWTQLLNWTTATYDISIDWWANSADRASMGIGFPESWYDASIIMIGNKKTNEDVFDLFAMFAPFDIYVWVMIIATIITTGLAYVFLERIDPYSDEKDLAKQPVESVYFAAINFTTHLNYHPRTHPARLLILSLSFWSMLVCAAYIANLASFLVVKNTKGIDIDHIEDVVRTGQGLCVFATTQADEELTKLYPTANIVRKATEKEMFHAVSNEECIVAVSTVSAWEFFKLDATVNGKCALERVGRTFKFVPAGFATKSDAGSLCTSLVRDVINIHLQRMKDDGFIDQAWAIHLQRSATVDCAARSAMTSETNEDSGTLSIINMGGIFVFHYILSFVAIVYALIYRWMGLAARRDQHRKEKCIRRHLERVGNQRQLKGLSDRPSELRQSLMCMTLDELNVLNDPETGIFPLVEREEETSPQSELGRFVERPQSSRTSLRGRKSASPPADAAGQSALTADEFSDYQEKPLSQEASIDDALAVLAAGMNSMQAQLAHLTETRAREKTA